MYKMEKEVQHEVKDYEDKKIKGSLIGSYESLVIVDHPYDRLCFVRKKMKDLGVKNENENVTDIINLLWRRRGTG